MRLILILLIAVIAFVVVQNYRHGCKFGETNWFHCVLGRVAVTTAPTGGEAPPPAPQ
jgi:hypothetical protein